MTQVAPRPQETPLASQDDVAPLPVAPHIERLTAYVPGKPIAEVERELGITGLIKLASNENPLGPSPRAQAALRNLASQMHLYPDANCHDLRDALSRHLQVSPESLVFGNGSDDVIHLLGVTLLEPGDEVIQGDPSFVRYEAAAILNDVHCHRVPLTPDWTHDLDAMAARVNDHTRLIFIANPNNPTGTILPRAALERFLARMPERVVVVIDEAYYEYAAASPDYTDALRWVREGRNVAVLRTFSKAYGLAALRIGYGVMRPGIAGWLNRSREPFNVNQIAQAAALAALDDKEFVAQSVAVNEQGKRALYAAFETLGLPYTPTYGNFIWVDVRRSGRDVCDALLHRGVIVRYSDSFGGPTHLRVSIGTPEEVNRFITTLHEVL